MVVAAAAEVVVVASAVEWSVPTPFTDILQCGGGSGSGCGGGSGGGGSGGNAGGTSGSSGAGQALQPLQAFRSSSNSPRFYFPLPSLCPSFLLLLHLFLLLLCSSSPFHSLTAALTIAFLLCTTFLLLIHLYIIIKQD